MVSRITGLAAILCGALAAQSADAQVIRRPTRSEPTTWVSGGVGLLQLGSVRDGRTQTVWEFGDATQYRASLERWIQANSTIGLAAGFSRVPVTYHGAACPGAALCDADARVTQVMASFHHGGAITGFHQVIQLQLGATVYHDFRERATGTALPPESPDADMAFSFGYGFGFALTPSVHLNVVHELGASMHQREGLPAAANTAPRYGITRIGLRIGVGR